MRISQLHSSIGPATPPVGCSAPGWRNCEHMTSWRTFSLSLAFDFAGHSLFQDSLKLQQPSLRAISRIPSSNSGLTWLERLTPRCNHRRFLLGVFQCHSIDRCVTAEYESRNICSTETDGDVHNPQSTTGIGSTSPRPGSAPPARGPGRPRRLGKRGRCRHAGRRGRTGGRRVRC